ncbi:hypothetical protein [Acinetobacter proteolyticus]|uniref:hypothetical protein n=1 Tax=Acinetobacter proteolyticus TaxID=1776741 RepID=UPI0031D68A0F
MTLNNLYRQKTVVTIYRVFISFFLISLITVPLYFLWYPYPFNKILDINHLILMIFLIDIVLAGLFTFIFFDSKRKDNKLNMRIITIIQIAAFLFGFYFFVQVRPAWLVQHQDRIYLVQPWSGIFPEKTNKFEQLLSQPWLGPEFKSVKFSEEKIKKQNQIYQSVSGIGLEYQPLEYHSFDQDSAMRYAQNISQLQQFNSQNDINAVLKNYSQQPKLWLALRSPENTKDMVILLNNNGSVIDIVDLRPW